MILLLLLLLSYQVVSDPCATPWTIAGQAPLSMGFSRQKYWSGLLCPSHQATGVKNVCIYTQPGRKTTYYDGKSDELLCCCIIDIVNCIYSTRRHFISFLLSWNWCKGLSKLLLLGLGPTSKTRRSSLNDMCLRAAVPTFLAPGTIFTEEKFFHGPGRWGMISGWFKRVTFNVHFISIIIISAPPQIVRH